MNQIFGDFVEQQSGRGEYLKIGFHPNSIPLQQRWRNNGLSADFLAGYLSTFFPGEDPASTARQAEIKDAVSFIANELLENAMKFSRAPANHTVTIEMFLDVDVVRLYTVNDISPDGIASLRRSVNQLLTGDTQALFLEQLERNANDKNGATSGLGFFTMVNDYGAALAWRLTLNDQQVDGAQVTTMVRLPV